MTKAISAGYLVSLDYDDKDIFWVASAALRVNGRIVDTEQKTFSKFAHAEALAWAKKTANLLLDDCEASINDR